MRMWIPPTRGDSQRKEKLRTMLRADKGIAGKWDEQRIWQNSIHRLPQLKQVKPALFLETCCYGFKTFFLAPCLSTCCRFKETGGGCVVRWRLRKKKKKIKNKRSPYHSLISFPKLWNRLWNRLFSLASWRESAWCSLSRAWPLAEGSVPFHKTTAVTNSLLALRARVGTGEGWQGRQGAESQERAKGSRKTTKTDRVEEAGWEFKQSQPNERLKQSAIFNRTAQLNVAGELKFWSIIELWSNFSASSLLCSWPSLLTSQLNVGGNFSRLHLCTQHFFEQSYIPNKPFQIVRIA